MGEQQQVRRKRMNRNGFEINIISVLCLSEVMECVFTIEKNIKKKLSWLLVSYGCGHVLLFLYLHRFPDGFSNIYRNWFPFVPSEKSFKVQTKTTSRYSSDLFT